MSCYANFTTCIWCIHSLYLATTFYQGFLLSLQHFVTFISRLLLGNFHCVGILPQSNKHMLSTQCWIHPSRFDQHHEGRWKHWRRIHCAWSSLLLVLQRCFYLIVHFSFYSSFLLFSWKSSWIHLLHRTIRCLSYQAVSVLSIDVIISLYQYAWNCGKLVQTALSLIRTGASILSLSYLDA